MVKVGRFTSAASWSYSVAQQSLSVFLSLQSGLTVQCWMVTALHSTVSKHFHNDDLINKLNQVAKASISNFLYSALFCTLTFSCYGVGLPRFPTLLFYFI